MMKAKTFLVVGGFALCLLSGCTHYESEPTFGKVPTSCAGMIIKRMRCSCESIGVVVMREENTRKNKRICCTKNCPKHFVTRKWMR